MAQNNSNEMNILIKELEKLKTENEQLKKDLSISKSQKINEKKWNNQIDNSELNKLKEENSNLKYQLYLRDNEIKDLKTQLQKNTIEQEKVNFQDIMVINFISTDSTVHFGIKCLPDNIFAEIEEKLYQKYNNLRETNNMFTANAKPVLRFKKLRENNIHDGDIIQLIKLE